MPNHETIPLGAVNGPSKTMGFAKFLLNFTGLTVFSVSLVVMRVSQSPYFRKAEHLSSYLKHFEVSIELQLKRLNYLACEGNPSLAFSQNLAFTIEYPTTPTHV